MWLAIQIRPSLAGHLRPFFRQKPVLPGGSAERLRRGVPNPDRAASLQGGHDIGLGGGAESLQVASNRSPHLQIRRGEQREAEEAAGPPVPIAGTELAGGEAAADEAEIDPRYAGAHRFCRPVSLC